MQRHRCGDTGIMRHVHHVLPAGVLLAGPWRPARLFNQEGEIQLHTNNVRTKKTGEYSGHLRSAPTTI
jgi:hypothetical protein